MKSFNKMQCAEHLLSVATTTYEAQGSCPAVVHLAGAAWDMAAAVSRDRQRHVTEEPVILQDDMWRQDKETMEEIQEIRNWIKHADRDPETQLDWRGGRRGYVANTSEVALHGAAIEIANANEAWSEAGKQVRRLLLRVAPKLAATMPSVSAHGESAQREMLQRDDPHEASRKGAFTHSDVHTRTTHQRDLLLEALADMTAIADDARAGTVDDPADAERRIKTAFDLISDVREASINEGRP